MNCLKCGKDIALGQVFCKDCLAHMEQHPVHPDTPVLLPNRSAISASRRVSHGHKNMKPEEKLVRLRRLILVQTLFLLAVLIAFVITVMVMNDNFSISDSQPLPGQNYNTVEDINGD